MNDVNGFGLFGDAAKIDRQGGPVELGARAMDRILALIVRAVLSLALVVGAQASATCLQGAPSLKVAGFEQSVLHAPSSDSSDNQPGKAIAHHHCPCHSHQIGIPIADEVASVSIDRGTPIGFDRSDNHPAAPPGNDLRPPIA